MLQKRAPNTETAEIPEEIDDGIIPTDDMDKTWITEQIKANFWNMLRNMRSEESKEYENGKYFTNAMQRKYFRTT